jgi:hypothetical protein
LEERNKPWKVIKEVPTFLEEPPMAYFSLLMPIAHVGFLQYTLSSGRIQKGNLFP